MSTTTQIALDLLDPGSALQTIQNMMYVIDIEKLQFFREINNYLNREIKEFGVNLLGRTMAWVGSVGIVLMTIWIMIQGFRIVTGQSRDSMAALVTNSLKATLIVGIATAWGAAAGSSLFDWMGSGLQKNITLVVTGNNDDVFQLIDENLGHMQVAFTSIDALQDGASPIAGDQKSRAMWFTGVGVGGPAVTAGVMLLLNKIALALFTGLGPIFILCLLFEQTKSLFSRWLFYGIGTMFSLAVLSVMVALALDIVKAVAAAFWINTFLGGDSEGISSMAMQQGGLGLVLTMLIISAPPMAASFFQGTLGQFMAYSQFGTSAGSQPGARGAGSPPSPNYSQPTNQQASRDRVSDDRPNVPSNLVSGQNNANPNNDVVRNSPQLGQAGSSPPPPTNLPPRPSGGGTSSGGNA